MTNPTNLTNDELDAALTVAIDAAMIAGEKTSEEIDLLFTERNARIRSALLKMQDDERDEDEKMQDDETPISPSSEVASARKRYSTFPSQDRFIRKLSTIEDCDDHIMHARKEMNFRLKNRFGRPKTYAALISGIERRKREILATR